MFFQLAAEYCIELHEKNEENYADGLAGLNFVMQKVLKVNEITLGIYINVRGNSSL